MKKIVALVLLLAMIVTLAACGKKEEPAKDTPHIGIVTGSVSQSEDDRRGAEAFQAKYGEDVVKTNEFHWMDDLAEDIVPIDAPEPPSAGQDVQYVMYLGTNDKDTNKPVFTQSEAKEVLKNILIKYLGGYTIQEADGGWIDDGKEYREYTLVIYLSDVTGDTVHAVADELIQTFRQSSILIQKNPTVTEFYSGAGR